MIMMDQLLTTGWLAACAVAPTVAALSVWLVFMVHCYRNKWRNVDMFVMVIACQQVAAAFVIFAFSVVNVVRSRNENACNVVIWALTSVRVFQVSTLASLAFDRLMSVKWPYKYRFTIRTSQIKYHVAVLGVISCLVGTAGLFARASAGDLRHRLTTEGTFDSSLFYCSLHPSSWDFRFNVFLVALYGLLSVAIVLCLLWTELRRLGAHQDKVRPTSRISSLGDLVADPLSDQGLPKSITGSYRSLYGANLQNSFQSGSNQENLAKKVFCDKLRSLDLRWASVLGLIGLCYAVNHGPTLVFIVLGMVVPRFWNPVHDELIVWFTVAEGLLLPITLYITDSLFRGAVKQSFRRKRPPVTKGQLKITSKDMMPPMSYNEFVIMEKPNPYGPGCTKSTTRLVFKEDLMARSPSAIGDYHHYHHHQQHVAHNHHHHQHNQLHQPGRQFVTKVGSCYLPAPQGAGNCPQRPVSGSGLVTRNNSQLRYMIPTIYAMEKVMQSNQPGQGSPLAASSSSSAGRPMASLVANQANNGLINQSSKSGLNNGHYDEMKQVHQNNNGLNNNKYNSMRKSLQSLTGKVNGSNLYICTPGSNRHHLHHQPNNGQEKLHHHQLQQQQQSKSDHLYVSINETMAATESPLPQKDGAPLSEGNLDSMATQTTLSAMDDEDDEDQVTGHFSDAETMSLDNVSFTTSANDDFEFHDTRDMDGDLDMKLYESSRSECDLQDTSLDMSIIALTEDFVHSAMSSSESELEEEEKSELVHEKPSQLKTKFAVKRLTTKLSQSSSSKLAEKRPFHSTTDLFKLDLSNCRASQYDKVTGSLTNLTQVGHLHHGDPRAGANNDPKWPPRPGRGYKSPMNTLSEDCESNSTTKTSLDTLKLTGLTDCGLLVNNGQPVKGDPRLDGGGHVDSDMNGCHGSEEEEETSQRQLESELSSKQICKIREAFNKHNLRNSLILRQKALQKKSIKSKLKKVNYTTKSSNDVSKDPKSTANYQQLRGQLANSKASPISRFGLSNIGRIGSYAQDWNRNAISIQPTSKLTSGQRSSSVSLIPTCK